MAFTLRILSFITAIFFLILSLVGFIPYAAPQDKLFGLFAVNPALNFLHLFTSLAAALATYGGDKLPFAFFRIFGIVYLCIALIGLIHLGYPIFGFIANSFQGNFFHALVGLVFFLFSLLSNVEPKKL